MPTPEEILATTASNFAQWRKTKTHAASPTPDALRQQAVELLEHFKFSKVMTTLRLSGSLLRRWSKEQSVTIQSQNHCDFVEFPPIEKQANHLTIELSLRNGCQMRLFGDLSTEQLNIFAQNFLMMNQFDQVGRSA